MLDPAVPASEISLEDLLPPPPAPADDGEAAAASKSGKPSSVRLDVCPDLGDNVITFPKEVEDAIAAVLPSEDPLDQPDFSTVDYINQSFPTEQSLNNLDDQVTDMK